MEDSTSDARGRRKNGTGTLEYIPSTNRWRARFTLRLPDGTKTRRSFTAKTREEVLNKVRAASNEDPRAYATALDSFRANKSHLTNIYFIRGRGGGLIKIGKAADVATRLAIFQAGSPVQLSVLAVIANCHPRMESRMHSYFAAHRAYGEWFAPSFELLHLIGQLRMGGPGAAAAITRVVEADKDEKRRLLRGEVA